MISTFYADFPRRRRCKRWQIMAPPHSSQDSQITTNFLSSLPSSFSFYFKDYYHYFFFFFCFLLFRFWCCHQFYYENAVPYALRSGCDGTARWKSSETLAFRLTMHFVYRDWLEMIEINFLKQIMPLREKERETALRVAWKCSETGGWSRSKIKEREEKQQCGRPISFLNEREAMTINGQKWTRAT